MAVKIDDKAEGRIEQQKILARNGRATVRGLRRWTTMLRVVLDLGNGPRRIVYGIN